MAPHSSTLAWKTPWAEEPGGLQSMGSLRVRHDWATSLSLFTFMRWRRKWQPTPVFCLENPRDGGAWWAAVYGLAQSRTRLKRLSSSSSGSQPGLNIRTTLADFSPGSQDIRHSNHNADVICFYNETPQWFQHEATFENQWLARDQTCSMYAPKQRAFFSLGTQWCHILNTSLGSHLPVVYIVCFPA